MRAGERNRRKEKTHVNFKRIRSIAWLIVVNIVIAACLLELALRVQQKIGPVYDLDLRPESIRIGLSSELNHVPLPGRDYDSYGIRGMDEDNPAQCPLKLLFMGDSFMEGLSRSATVPVHVKQYLKSVGRELCVFNAGCSTYSPSIFVPQAKKLIPLLKPDIIVIDVDETDLFDDYHRYRDLVVRDPGGSITAVRQTPMTAAFQRGLVESTKKTLYLRRFFSKLYFTKFEYPRAFAAYIRDKPTDLFWVSRLSETAAREKHGAEIEYFKRTLEDLTQSVLSQTGRPDGLIYIHHPHLEHLKTGGDMFNDIVARAIEEIASRHKVRFYDATEDLKKAFGAEPDKFYIPNDMHFNSAGLRAYGGAVAKYLAGTFDGK